MVGGPYISHEPIVESIIIHEISISRSDPVYDNVLEGLVISQTHTKSDSVAHAFEVHRFDKVVIVQVRLYIRVLRCEPQLSGTYGKLQTGAQTYVVPVIIDLDLGRSVLAGHQHRTDLHVIANAGTLDGVAESHLNNGCLDIRALTSSMEQYTRGRMIPQVLAHTWQVLQHADVHRPEMVRRANSGEQQKLRGSDCSCA